MSFLPAFAVAAGGVARTQAMRRAGEVQVICRSLGSQFVPAQMSRVCARDQKRPLQIPVQGLRGHDPQRVILNHVVAPYMENHMGHEHDDQPVKDDLVDFFEHAV